MDSREEVQGVLIRVDSDSIVTMRYVTSTRFSRDIYEIFELEGLGFYTGTSALREFMKCGVIRQNEVFLLKLGGSSTVTERCRGHYPRVLRIYQDFEFGRVYLNKIIQLGINRMIKNENESFKKGEGGRRMVSFLKATSTGQVWLQQFVEFRDKIVNFCANRRVEKAQLREETFETLMNKVDIVKNIFLALYRGTGTYQRVRVTRVIRGKRPQVEVRFIDFGEDDRLDVENFYDASLLDENFASFPPLCLKYHLLGVVSLDVDEFENLIKGKQLYAEQVSVQERTNTNNSNHGAGRYPYANLFTCDVDGTVERMNEVVVDEGIAIPAIADQFAELYHSETFRPGKPEFLKELNPLR